MYSGSGGFGFAFRPTPWVKRLLIANGVMFLATLMIGNPRFVVDWLAFQPNRVLIRPWGAITYMFVHADFWHVFMNMLVLFFFGPPLEGRWGSKEFIKFYAICGLGGVALSFVFAPAAPIIGASAAVYGVMMAFAMAWPTAPIYIWGIFPVQARWLIAFLFVMTFLSALGGPSAVQEHCRGLIEGFMAELDRDRYEVPTSEPGRTPILALRAPSTDGLIERLIPAGVTISVGGDADGLLRISPGIYSDAEDMARLLEVLQG